MFESAELGHAVDRETYDKEAVVLREQLLEAQYELLERKKFPLIIVIGGVDGAGKGETVNELISWMDARHIHAHALDAPTDEERERPPMWTFWRQLPPKGKTGIFMGSWYTHPIEARVAGVTKNADLDASTEEIKRFERMLADEGALVLKFWFHLSKVQQKRRLEKLEKKASTRWRVTRADWESFALYDRYRSASERVLRQTSTGEAPWIVIEGADARYRQLTVAKAVLEALERRLTDAVDEGPARAAIVPPTPATDDKNVLRELDLGKTLAKADYKKELAVEERRLALLSRSKGMKDIAVVAVFEGSDAAGKGGAIRRVTGALDARYVHVTPIAAPTEEERAQPYLWRFWREIPRKGRIQIFDRSWYGRVLVERVEGYCQPADWMRAYSEINDFEEQLARGGAIVVKFWLQIGEDEQLARFKARENTSFKRFKITKEDWRNRDKWGAYESAVCDMVDRTSTENAPWKLVPANDKRYARVTVLRELCDRMERAL